MSLQTRLFEFLAGADASEGVTLDRWHAFQDASCQTRCTVEQWHALCAAASVGGSGNGGTSGTSRKKKSKKKSKGKRGKEKRKAAAAAAAAAVTDASAAAAAPTVAVAAALDRATFIAMFSQIPKRDLRIACRVAQIRMAGSGSGGGATAAEPAWEESAGFPPRSAALRAPFSAENAADGGEEARSKLATIFATFDDDGDGLLAAREWNTFLVAAGGIPDGDDLTSVAWCEQRPLGGGGSAGGTPASSGANPAMPLPLTPPPPGGGGNGITLRGFTTFVEHYDMLDLLFEQEVLVAKITESAAKAEGRASAAPLLRPAMKRASIMQLVCRRCIAEHAAAAASLQLLRSRTIEEDDDDEEDSDLIAKALAAWEKSCAELRKYSGAMRAFVDEELEAEGSGTSETELVPLRATLAACHEALASAI